MTTPPTSPPAAAATAVAMPTPTVGLGTSFPNEATVKTLAEYTSLFETKMGKVPHNFWYRGSGESDYRLEPTLFRHPIKKDIKSLLSIELELITRFRQRSVPYLSGQTLPDWDLLFLMQHFGVPTRLLDWTENPYIALYFALSSARSDYSTGSEVFTKDAAVWVLDPLMWNQHALKHMTYKEGVLSVTDTRIKTYAPVSKNFDSEEMLNEPVAIYGTHNSPRIVAQRGAFMVFGKETRPAELTYSDSKYPTDALLKIVIPKDDIAALALALLKIGYTDAVVFPDLEGLARELKRLNGFRR